MATHWPDLPVEAVRDEVMSHWQNQGCLVMSPPGSGKTTRLPLWLLQAGTSGTVLILPRRLPVQLAARYLAEQWHQPLGQSIGYRLRLDTKISADTRLTVTTYGSFLRWLQNDPDLNGIDTVILDEFHERQLNQDLCLSLLHSCRELFRPDLKILVMSATLSLDRLHQALDLPKVTSDGVSHPLSIHYRPLEQRDWLPGLIDAVCEARARHDGHILVFLPGLREIERCAAALETSAPVFKVHSQIPTEGLYRSLTDACDGLILSTNLAESSVTLPGVRVVIDLGLERYPVANPITGLTELKTRRISKSSAVQRAGRAARLGPGNAYRLWSADQHNALAPDQPAAILQADLTPLVMMLAQWGSPPEQLFWLTPPTPGRWHSAKARLEQWGALDASLRLTSHGQQMQALGIEPALAHLISLADYAGLGSDAAWLAAALAHHVDWARQLIEQGQGSLDQAPNTLRQEAKKLARQLNTQLQTQYHRLPEPLLIEAMSHRLVRRNDQGGLNLANGTRVKPGGEHAQSNWYLLMSGQDKGDCILADWLQPVSDRETRTILKPYRSIRCEVSAGYKTRFIEEVWLGPFKLEENPSRATPAQRQQAWLDWLKKTPLVDWPNAGQTLVWLERLSFVRSTDPDWPETPSTETLAGQAEPYLSGVHQLAALPTQAIVTSWLGYNRARQLDELCPLSWQAPSGRLCSLDYDGQNRRVSAEVKLQEVFGLTQSPTILSGKVSISLSLLAPNGRVLAQVSDLSYFWSEVYPQVRKEMRGRYNKHPWPENPILAIPTRSTNRQLAKQKQGE